MFICILSLWHGQSSECVLINVDGQSDSIIVKSAHTAAATVFAISVSKYTLGFLFPLWLKRNRQRCCLMPTSSLDRAIPCDCLIAAVPVFATFGAGRDSSSAVICAKLRPMARLHLRFQPDGAIRQTYRYHGQMDERELQLCPRFCKHPPAPPPPPPQTAAQS